MVRAEYKFIRLKTPVKLQLERIKRRIAHDNNIEDISMNTVIKKLIKESKYGWKEPKVKE